MNNVSLVGRLTANPELKTTVNGRSYVMFSIGVDRVLSKEKREELNAENRPTADFPRIAVYGSHAEAVCKYLKQGSLISISGAVRTDVYDGADGDKKFFTDIVARSVRFLDPKKQSAIGGEEIEIEVHDDIPF